MSNINKKINKKKNKKKTPYMICKEKIVDSYMKKFERGELKSSNNKIVKNRLQAVAMALSLSEKVCEKKISKKDIEFKEERVNKMIFDKDGKFLNTKLQLSNVKNSLFLLDYYKKKRSTKKYNLLMKNLFSRALCASFKNNLTPNVIKELKKIM